MRYASTALVPNTSQVSAGSQGLFLCWGGGFLRIPWASGCFLGISAVGWGCRLGSVVVGDDEGLTQGEVACGLPWHGGRATCSVGGAAPVYVDSLLVDSFRSARQYPSGNYSGLATPIDPLGAGPIPM